MSSERQQFVKYKTFDAIENSFSDKQIVQNNTYSYTLKAKDQNGKETEFSNIVKWNGSK